MNLGDSDEDSDEDSDNRENINDDSDLRGSDADSEMDVGEDDDEDGNDEDDDEEEEGDEEGEEQVETEEEDEEVSEDNENSGEDDEDAGGKMLKGKLASKKCAEMKGILNEPKSKDKREKKTVSFGENSKVEEPKKKQSVALTEDIYGRLRDKQGNVVKDSNAFVPPGRRQLQQRDGEGLQTLKVQISRIINR